MRAIVGAIESGRLRAEPRLTVSNRPGTPALAFAGAHGIPQCVVPTKADPVRADRMLALALAGAGVELVVLSGYLRKLGPETLGAYANRILNIHPALLPAFGGPGMYGRRVHEAVAASGVAETGVTVHLVDDQYDHGPIVATKHIGLDTGESAASIEAKVTAAEPGFFVQVLQRIAEGALRLPQPSDPISDNLH